MQELPDGIGLHIPGYECEIMRSTYRSGRSVTLWVFMCPYCLCWHPHKAEEGVRSHVCHSDEGKAAHKYGYYLRLGPSGPVAPYS